MDVEEDGWHDLSVNLTESILIFQKKSPPILIRSAASSDRCYPRHTVVVPVNEPTPGSVVSQWKYAGVAITVRVPCYKTIVARCVCDYTTSTQEHKAFRHRIRTDLQPNNLTCFSKNHNLLLSYYRMTANFPFTVVSPTVST